MNFTSIPAVSLAVSIIICWALFAMFCSFIHEAVVQVKAERGRFMKMYLLKQLADPVNEINWGLEVYRQGSIAILTRDPKKPTNDIDPTLFSQALIGAVASSHLVQTIWQAQQRMLASENLLYKPEEIEKLDTIRNQQSILSKYKNEKLAGFKAATFLLQPSTQVDLFISSLQQAETAAMDKDGVFNENLALQALESSLQNWYVEFTQRMTLWYQKQTRMRLFYLGLLLALLFNVDSIDLFKSFNKNKHLQQAVISYYTSHVSEFSDSALLTIGPENQDSTAERWAKYIIKRSAIIAESKIIQKDTAINKDSIKALNKQATAMADSAAHYRTDTLIRAKIDFLNSLDSQIVEDNLPIGLQYNVFARRAKHECPYLLLKLLGIAISGLAASFGGPFWFDLLKKIYTPSTK